MATGNRSQPSPNDADLSHWCSGVEQSGLAACTARGGSNVHARLLSVIVLVPGYSGPLSRVVDRWRMELTLATLEHGGGGHLVVSGHRGEAERIAIASDFFHARRARAYLRELNPALAGRVVPAHRQWPRGIWVDAAGALDSFRRWVRRAH